MIDEIRLLLARISKSRLAAELCIERTTTIDMWTSRGKVPTKYHIRIQELVNEFVKQG
jgi:hypothetical protein